MPQDQDQVVKELADRRKVAEAALRQRIRIGGLRAAGIGKGRRIPEKGLGGFPAARQPAPRMPGTGLHGRLSGGNAPCWS